MYYLTQADRNHSEHSPIPENWHRLKAASPKDAAIRYLRRNPGIMQAYAPKVWIIVAEDSPNNKHKNGMPLYVEAFMPDGRRVEWSIS
jgi:hypothetical protein